MSPFTLALITVISLLVLFVALVIRSAFRQMGSAPSGERQRRIEGSPQYDRAKGTFRNERQRDFKKDMPVLAMIRELVFGPQIRTPTAPLPSQRPDLQKFLSSSGAPIHATWLGHSTVLLRVAGKTILLDPTLTERISPVFFFGRRFQPPALKLEELPHIDFLVISHDHYDHLDADSVRFFARPDRVGTRIITALGVGSRLESFGISTHRIVELDWWEKFEEQGFEFTATPSQHFSGRSYNDNAKTLWAGIAIRHASANIYFSGDSGYYTHFKKIGDALGPFDFAILESGQYNVWWHYVHMLPEEVVRAAQDLGAKVFLPIHWGMYNLAMHDWFEPIMRVTEIAKEQQVAMVAPTLGEVFEIDSRHPPVSSGVRHWWQSHPDFIKRSGESRGVRASSTSTPHA